jgi:hypothetical protein
VVNASSRNKVLWLAKVRRVARRAAKERPISFASGRSERGYVRRWWLVDGASAAAEALFGRQLYWHVKQTTPF